MSQAEDRFSSGRPARDEQMKALQRMLGTPSRQRDELPKIAEKSMVAEPPRTADRLMIEED